MSTGCFEDTLIGYCDFRLCTVGLCNETATSTANLEIRLGLLCICDWVYCEQFVICRVRKSHCLINEVEVRHGRLAACSYTAVAS